MTDTIAIKRPSSTPERITAEYPSAFLCFFAVADEWLGADEPLSSFLVAHLAAEQAALFEWLRDRPVPGNDEASIHGHHHPRVPAGTVADSVRIPRAGTFELGFLRSRQISSTSYQDIPFELLNTDFPDLDHEQSGVSLATPCPELYLSVQHTRLRYPIEVYVGTGQTGNLRLELLDADEQPLAPPVLDERAVTWNSEQTVWLELDLPDILPDGFVHLRLQGRVALSGNTMTVKAADGAWGVGEETQRGWLQ